MEITLGNANADKYARFGNSISSNLVKTAMIYLWWYEEISRIDPALRTSDPPHA